MAKNPVNGEISAPKSGSQWKWRENVSANRSTNFPKPSKITKRWIDSVVFRFFFETANRTPFTPKLSGRSCFQTAGGGGC
jgi:hypothetical protein